MSEKLQFGIILLILVGVFVATSWSVFVPGMFRVHDYVHGARIAEIVRGVEAGHFPVRWSDHFGFGYGMPLYIFYAPLPYYFGGFIYWLSNNLIWGVKSLFLLANIGSIIGGYFFGARLANSKRGGIIGAVAFGLAPYRALNLFVRGAVSEAWAMMFLVWLWYGVIGLMGFSKAQKDKNTLPKSSWKLDWWIVLASSVGVMLSHNLTTLMTFSSLAFGILFWILSSIPYTLFWNDPSSWKKISKETFIQLLTPLFRISSALVLAGGLASFYLIPMFMEKSFIRSDIFLSGYFDFRLHFLYIRQFFDTVWAYGGSTWGPDDDISFFVGWPFFVSITSAIIATFFVLAKTLFQNKNSFKFAIFTNKQTYLNFKQYFLRLFEDVSFKLIALFVFLTAGTLFFTLQKSSILWEFLPLIENIQFPWRWLSVATVGITALSVLSITTIEQICNSKVIHSLPRLTKKISFKNAFLALSTSLIVIGAFLQTPFFTPEFWLDTPETLYYQDPDRIQKRMSEIMLDYVPKTAILFEMNKERKIGLPTIDSLEALITTEFSISDTQFISEYKTLVNDPHQKLVSLSTDTVSQVVFSTADFPGWNVYVNAEKVEKEITELGLLAITVTPGEHQIGIRFENTLIRSLADAITFISSIVLVSVAIAHTRNTYD